MNEFEKACNEVEKNVRDYSLEQDNAIEFLKNSKTATVTFTQERYITKIERLAKKYPDDVQIVHRNKGSIVAHIPTHYIQISNRKREMSEEERKAIGERLRSYVLDSD